MGGGGKGGTSTSTVSIPPEVLARYNAVNARAEDVAQQPFQSYGGEFVAPLNQVQQQGVSQTQQYSQAAQPYYTQAAGLTQQAVDATKPLTAAQIQQYQNPYVQNVVDPTLAALRQQQGIDQAGQQAQAIRSGAFGGERAGLQRAVLQGQQELAQAQAISPLYASAYQNALAAAQQQQQQRTAGFMGAGQQIAGIGTGAQQAGLQGAQAAIGAGTLGQQTQQALDTAKYQQFLQQRGYDFQVAQFLANIAEGTGALSGSTTTTTQPTSFFSDKRLKENIKKIGKTNDGLPIYSFKYKGDDRTQIGLMAQDVEKKRPDAVGLAGGYKTVDYAKATAGARHARAAGGLIPNDLSDALLALEFAPLSQGGAVFEPGAYNRGGFAGGGLITDPNDLKAILAAQKQSFGPFGSSGLYGGSAQQDPHGAVAGYVPKAGLAVPKLVTSSFQPKQQQGGLQSAMQDINAASTATSNFSKAYDWATGKDKEATDGSSGSGGANLPANAPLPPHRPPATPEQMNPEQKQAFDTDSSKMDYDVTGDAISSARGGGIMPRNHFEGGGFIDPYATPTSGSMIPEDVMQDSEETKDKAEKEAVKPDGSRGSSGGGGGGLGTALGVAKTAFDVGKFILPFFGLKDGGVVPRHGYQTDGTVKDPLAGYDPKDLAIRTIAAETGGHPDETAGIAAVVGNRLANGKYGDNYRSVVTAPNQFEPWNNPNATNYPTRIDPNGDRYKQAAAALSRYETEGYDPTGGANHFWAPKAQAALGRDAPSWGREGGIDLGATRFHKIDDGAAPQRQTQQQAYPLQKQVEGGIGAAKGALDSIAPRTYLGEDRTMGQFLTSKDFVIPLLTGLGTMASSPSRYLGSAILQGLGGAATSYANLQKQQADIDQTRALTSSTLSGIGPLVAQYDKEGKMTVKAKPDYFAGQTLTGKDGTTVGGVPTPGGGTSATAQAGIKPVTAIEAPSVPKTPVVTKADAGAYNYDVVPSTGAVEKLRQYGATGGPNDKASIQYTLAAYPEQQKAAQEEGKVAQVRANDAYKSSQTRSDLNTMSSAFTSIPDEGLAGKGPGFAERARLFNIYNFAAKNSGGMLPIYDAGDASVTNQQILNKLATLNSGDFARTNGSHAGYIQQAITSALPQGEMTEQAGVKVLASMYAANQMDEDFRKYYQNYVSRYGTAWGVQDAFNADMQPRLQREKQLIEHALTPQMINGVRQSPADVLRKNFNNPAAAAEFDKRYGVPGLARMIVGG
jgi:hypothetical protein